MSQTFDLLHEGFRPLVKPRAEAKASEPPFRSYSEFLSRTLNPQKFSGATIDAETASRSHEKWFVYQCVRRANQFTGRINFTKALTYLAEGIKEGGKSEILNNISARFPKVVVVYMAGDEGLADFRMFDHRDDPYLPRPIQENVGRLERRLIVGTPGVDIKSSYNYVTWDKLTLNDIEKHDVIVAPQRIHTNPTTVFQCGEKIISLLENRVPHENSKGEIFLKVLEAADIVYARIALKGARTEAAKARLVFLVRHMRHHGVAMGMDFQYSNSMDLEVKTNADYSFVKNMGSDKLPKNINWMYGFFQPIGLMSLYQNEFVCKDKWGGLYMGWFKMTPWSKTPKEDIYASLGLKIDVGDPVVVKTPAKAQQAEDVAMHSAIIAYFADPKNKPSARAAEKVLGYNRDTIAKHMKRHEAQKCGCFNKPNA